ncbi:hypothetical protein ACFWHT_10120 [Microbacterium sp. NPDC058342]|uniref:hypothetical protein n=1 Tax=Microbacterium sp. NPDC058342 TaxID=3346454 RepID=UPI003653F9DF
MSPHASRRPRAAAVEVTGGIVPLACLSWVINAAYGALIATGAVRRRRTRWVHHALFIATSTLTGLSLLAALVERRDVAVVLLPAAAAMAAMPATRGGTAQHTALALSAAPWYASAVMMVRR